MPAALSSFMTGVIWSAAHSRSDLTLCSDAGSAALMLFRGHSASRPLPRTSVFLGRAVLVLSRCDNFEVRVSFSLTGLGVPFGAQRGGNERMARGGATISSFARSRRLATRMSFGSLIARQ
jgi:hypothetical protein